MSSHEKPAELADRADDAGGRCRLVRRHLRVGWWSLAAFLTLGIVLEAFHGLKIGWYLNAPENETRRLMWTLAHAHGTLLGLVHVAMAVTLPLLPRWQSGRLLASRCLCGASLTLPTGFLLGGLFLYGQDPGLGIWMVPVGGLLLLVAVVLVAQGASGKQDEGGEGDDEAAVS